MQLTHTHIQFCVVNPRGRLSQTPLLAHTHTYVKQGGGRVVVCRSVIALIRPVNQSAIK
jgi:hypothetical protein